MLLVSKSSLIKIIQKCNIYGEEIESSSGQEGKGFRQTLNGETKKPSLEEKACTDKSGKRTLM